MTCKDISNAVSNISSRHIEEAEDFFTEIKGKKPVRKKWGAVAAVICLFIASTLLFFYGQTRTSPIVITAYALENDGSLTAQEMQQGIGVPLSVIKINDDIAGYLFSCPLVDPDEVSQLSVICLKQVGGVPTEYIFEMIQERGFHYFYFIPPDDDPDPYCCTLYITKEDGTLLDYEILIGSSEAGYTATLISQIMD